ncbi:MAG: hypothetical protein AAF587_30610 [Bacteroidota bacterium]
MKETKQQNISAKHHSIGEYVGLLDSSSPVASLPSPPLQFARPESTTDVIQADFGDDFMNVMGGIGNGIMSVGEDLVGGAKRTGRGLNFFDSGEQARIGAENERAFFLLKSLFDNREQLNKIIQFTIEHIYNKLPAEKQQKVKEKLTAGAESMTGYAIGRLLIGTAIAKAIIRRIAARIAVSQLYKSIAKKIGVSAGASATGVGIPISLLMLQGVLERAGQASRRLKSEYPELSRKLTAQNLDMAWFLVEPYFEEIKTELLDGA